MDPTEATTRIVEVIIQHHGVFLIGPPTDAGIEARAAAVGDAAGALYQAVWHAVVHADDPDE